MLNNSSGANSCAEPVRTTGISKQCALNIVQYTPNKKSRPIAKKNMVGQVYSAQSMGNAMMAFHFQHQTVLLIIINNVVHFFTLVVEHCSCSVKI